MTKTLRGSLRFAIATALLFALTVLPASAAGSWTTFSVDSGCSGAISVDGDRLTMANEYSPRQLYYYTPATGLVDTGIVDALVPVIKGDNIVFNDGLSGDFLVYSISKAKATRTRASTNRVDINDRRYFNGTYIAYVDGVDSHFKLYSVEKGRANPVTDTGIVLSTSYRGSSRLTIDGDIVAVSNDGQVGYYNIATQTMTYFDSISSGYYNSLAIVTGNLISYRGAGGTLKYYTINDGQVHDTSIAIREQANDGSRIAYTAPSNGTVKIFDPATGGIQDTGQYVCDGSTTCWLEFSGGKLYSELWEGGTRDESGSVVYPPQDYNNDGQIEQICVHAMTTVPF